MHVAGDSDSIRRVLLQAMAIGLIGPSTTKDGLLSSWSDANDRLAWEACCRGDDATLWDVFEQGVQSDLADRRGEAAHSVSCPGQTYSPQQQTCGLGSDANLDAQFSR